MDQVLSIDASFPPWLQDGLTRNITFSVALILVLLLARFIVNRIVTPRLETAEERRRWLSGSRTTIGLMLVFGLAAVWANAIQSFLLSIVALAAAMVLATKELILCLTGSFVRAVGNSYTLGDRIEWGPVRGDVIDISLFTTSLLEVGPGHRFHMPTGRTIVVPNSKLLDTPVFNESRTGKYVVHMLSIPLAITEDIERAQQIALESILDVCKDFLEPAREWMEGLEHTHNFIHTPSAEPRVYLNVAEPQRIDMLLRFPSPVRRQGRIEQAILRRFLQDYFQRPMPQGVDILPNAAGPPSSD